MEIFRQVAATVRKGEGEAAGDEQARLPLVAAEGLQYPPDRCHHLRGQSLGRWAVFLQIGFEVIEDQQDGLGELPQELVKGRCQQVWVLDDIGSLPPPPLPQLHPTYRRDHLVQHLSFPELPEEHHRLVVRVALENAIGEARLPLAPHAL